MQKLPDNWTDRTLLGSTPRATRQARMTLRARQTPDDSVVKLDQEIKARVLTSSPWHGEKINLRLLSLSRNPNLSSSKIAEMLNRDFEKNFTKGAIIGRLRELKDISKGFRRKRYKLVGFYRERARALGL